MTTAAGPLRPSALVNRLEGVRLALGRRFTVDERIADGYYYSKSIKLLKYLLEHPELLERPANEEVDYDHH